MFVLFICNSSSLILTFLILLILVTPLIHLNSFLSSVDISLQIVFLQLCLFTHIHLSVILPHIFFLLMSIIFPCLPIAIVSVLLLFVHFYVLLLLIITYQKDCVRSCILVKYWNCIRTDKKIEYFVRFCCEILFRTPL